MPPSPHSTKPTIGFLGAVTPAMWSGWVTAFERAARRTRLEQGRHHRDRLQMGGRARKELHQICQRICCGHVDVIVTGGTQATMACKKAAGKSTIPVVFATAGDPIDSKLVPTFTIPAM